MFQKSKPIHMKGTASLLYNNLTVLNSPEKNMTTYAVVHKSVVCMASCASDTSNVSHKQVACKDPSPTPQSTMILQAKFCQLPSRTLLVLCYQRGIQVYEPDGSALVFWHALVHIDPSVGMSFARGIAAVHDSYIAIGTSTAQVLIFNVPARGTNVTLSESLTGHSYPISALAGDGAIMASADDSGCIMVWQARQNFTRVCRINGGGVTCSSVCFFDGLVIGGFGSGHIRVFDAMRGTLVSEICAHAKWIHAIDIAPTAGLLLSTSEDTFVRVWSVSKDGDVTQIQLMFSESVSDTQLSGAQFTNKSGRSFALSGYDLNEVVCYNQKV
ncbi:WD repeat-containing protein 54-like [Patiria miniata]|uniref:WD repeat-containing protein 54 beta-propeller domain-containing protein n=1 Tax=Patiria miniata TaxID=46514 RepID=A0A914B3X6_PATMI|nr:WD repeat-containing protein 54-like [Patiria miniata]